MMIISCNHSVGRKRVVSADVGTILQTVNHRRNSVVPQRMIGLTKQLYDIMKFIGKIYLMVNV